jgi:hypothetical protein
MALGQEYRWNVPVVTYGFDQAFLDYFGSNGVAAVEAAIEVLNVLPPASKLDLTDFSTDTTRLNYLAQALGFYDLESLTLSLLLEQLGLEGPTWSIWTLRQWDARMTSVWDELSLGCEPWTTNYVLQRNYDPVSQQPSQYIHGTPFSFWISKEEGETPGTIVPFPLDPYGCAFPVADQFASEGFIYTGLTRDDIGGLLYLYHRTNVNVESLSDTISSADPNEPLIRTAPRPGVEKVHFIRHHRAADGSWLNLTNVFADVYFDGAGSWCTQRVQRVVACPDFVFSAADLGFYRFDLEERTIISIRFCERSTTAGWVQNSALNGNPDADGPGTIMPPIKITFQTTGPYVATVGGKMRGADFNLFQWAWFDCSTNIVVFTGPQITSTIINVGTHLITTNGSAVVQWTALGKEGARYRIEESPDLSHWTTNTVLTNSTGVFRFRCPADRPMLYLRAILENE